MALRIQKAKVRLIKKYFLPEKSDKKVINIPLEQDFLLSKHHN